MSGIELHTERLILREWRDADLQPFSALNADSEVMRFMPRQLSREESDDRARRIRDHFKQHGFGLWAVEVRDGQPFVGFVGLSVPRFETDFTPCVEVGWRLARSAWGNGYATEAAKRAVTFGFNELGLTEVVSYTVPENLRSRRVMERLGMTHDPSEKFDHPLLEEGHPLRRHVLYRLSRSSSDGSILESAATDGTAKGTP
ncbi:MAG TPA: GNAT family N-acetyltransferase [Planctomycetaceae bacterium]|nr:GNAT family N-acetyltransferase [Planctomycetaceae bacterium]